MRKSKMKIYPIDEHDKKSNHNKKISNKLHKKSTTTGLLYEVVTIFLLIVITTAGVYFFSTRLSKEYFAMRFISKDLSLTLEQMSIMPPGYNSNYYFNLTRYTINLRKSNYDNSTCILELMSYVSGLMIKQEIDCSDTQYIVKINRSRLTSLLRFIRLGDNKVVITNLDLDELGTELGPICEHYDFKKMLLINIKDDNLKTTLFNTFAMYNISYTDYRSLKAEQLEQLIDRANPDLFVLITDINIFKDQSYADYISSNFDLFVLQQPSLNMKYSNNIICRLGSLLNIKKILADICLNQYVETKKSFDLCFDYASYNITDNNQQNIGYIGYVGYVDHVDHHIATLYQPFFDSLKPLYRKDLMLIYVPNNIGYDKLINLMIAIR